MAHRTADFRALKPWPTFLTAVALLALDLVIAYLVGHAAAPQGARFDWNAAASAATAFGTIALAVFTAGLAFATLGDVSATREIAALTRDEASDRQRPTVVVSDVRGSASGSREGAIEGEITVELTNIGTGPALKVELEATLAIPGVALQVTYTPPSRIIPTIPAGPSPVTARFRYKSNGPMPESIEEGSIAVTGTYLDRRLELVGEIVDVRPTAEHTRPRFASLDAG